MTIPDEALATHEAALIRLGRTMAFGVSGDTDMGVLGQQIAAVANGLPSIRTARATIAQLRKVLLTEHSMRVPGHELAPDAPCSTCRLLASEADHE